MVKDHSDSERENPLPSHRLLFPISSKGSLYASSNRHDNIYHGLCYTSRGALAGTRVVVNQFAQFPILRYKIFHPNDHRLYVLDTCKQKGRDLSHEFVNGRRLVDTQPQ